MAEEGGSTSVATPAAATPATPPAETPSMVVPDGITAPLAEKSDIVDKRGSLFEDEQVLSEEELTGEDPTVVAPGVKDAATPPLKGADGKDHLTAEEQAAQAAAAEERKAAAEDTSDPVVKATSGLRQALVEERGQRKATQQQLEQAHQTILQLQDALQGKPAEATADPLAPFKDFKELTDDQFKELVSTDYAEAQLYLKNLADYREAKRTVADREERQRTVANLTQTHLKTIVETSRDAMAREVPGLYDPNSDVNQKLMDFAAARGMDVDLLVALTDPATQLIERGAKGGKYVGQGAVATLRFLKSAFEAEQRTEARLREEITNELVTKFKIDTGGFKSLGDTPSVITTPGDTGQMLSEEQLETMSEGDRRKYLGG